jgi:hypothetical protein
MCKKPGVFGLQLTVYSLKRYQEGRAEAGNNIEAIK